jgi:hypothetical protein
MGQHDSTDASKDTQASNRCQVAACVGVHNHAIMWRSLCIKLFQILGKVDAVCKAVCERSVRCIESLLLWNTSLSLPWT